MWRGFQILLLSWVDCGSERLLDSVQFHLANQKQDWSGSVELQFLKRVGLKLGSHWQLGDRC